MLGCASLAYAVVVLCTDNIECYAYAFPILFASMALLNVRFVIAGDTVIVLTNVTKLAIRYSGADVATEQSLFVTVFASILTCFAAFRVVKH